jgi:hypothetical protein
LLGIFRGSALVAHTYARTLFFIISYLWTCSSDFLYFWM